MLLYRKNELFGTKIFKTDMNEDLDKLIREHTQNIVNEAEKLGTNIDIVETTINSSPNLDKHIVIIQYAIVKK